MMLLDPVTLADARSAVAGRVLTAADADYDQARHVWNGMIDRRPAVIVQASTVADIAPVLALARETGLPLAIRGGGHNVAGNGTVDGGIVLDLGRLRSVDVDPAARLVRVGAGATLKDVDAATEAHGLAVPIGVVSGTGIAGLTLGGGVGWLTRRYGLTIDNLVAASVVLPNGDLVRASELEHPDLFWALRGGGGNFGVVTEFTFRAHPLGPEVYAGTLIYEQRRWPEAIRAWVEWTAQAPDGITTIATFMVPPADWDAGDRVCMFLGYAWAGGDRRQGEDVVGRLMTACPPDLALTDPTRWITFQSAFDSAMPRGSRAYWRNAWFRAMDDGLIDVLAEGCGRQDWVGTAADIHHMGGAFARVPEEATAFPDRSAMFWLNIYGFWRDAAEDADRIAWAKDVSDAVQPRAMTTRYVNFLGRDEAADAMDRARLVYGPAKLERLQAIKRRYDPENLLRINHNIPPSG